MHYILIFIAFICFSLLIFATSTLGLELAFGIPFGNIVAMALLASWAGSLMMFTKQHPRMHNLSRTLLLFACLWLPLSIALCGNPRLQFADDAILWWLGYTAIVILCMLLISFILLIQTLMKLSYK